MKKFFLLFAVLAFFINSNAQEKLYGYNIAHIFPPFPNHKVNSEAMSLFDQLSPDVLRFPGGSLANKYHYSKPGYGWSKPDMKRKENYIVDFVKLVKDLKTEPKVIYVYNMFDHFKGANEAALIKENMDAVKYLIANGIDVIAVELGNEFYLYNEIVGMPGQITFNPENNNIDAIETGDVKPGDIKPNQAENETKPAPKKKDNWLVKWLKALTGKKNFTNVKSKNVNEASETNNARLNKYSRLAKIYHDKTKQIDPSIRTGVPLGNFKNKKHTEYNNFVLANFPYADAYVVHFYGSFNKNCKKGDLACVKAGLDWSISATIEPRLKYIKENTNKEIWVTEWNAIKFGHWGDESPWIRNTSTHLEYTKVFIDLFDKYGVTISNYHKLVGPPTGSAYNVIDVATNGKCTATPIFNTLKKYY